MIIKMSQLIFPLVLCCLMMESVNMASTPALSAPPPKTVHQHLNSYVPAVMQVLAHFTNQMKFERDPPPSSTTSSPSTSSSSTTTVSSTTTMSSSTTSKTTTSTTTTTESSSSEEEIEEESSTMKSTTTTSSTTTESSVEDTTPIHAPANVAPLVPGPPRTILANLEPETFIPPIPLPSLYQSSLLLPEYQGNLPYSPQQNPSNFDDQQQEYYSFPAFMIPFRGYYSQKPEDRPLFLPGNYAQNPSGYPDWFSKARTGDTYDSYRPAEEYPDLANLPVQNENNFKLNPLDSTEDELTEENLQYLAPSVREILEGFHSKRKGQIEAKNNPTALYQSIEDLYDNPNEKKKVGDWLRSRKAAVTQTYIQFLLLYDLLSRDAKNQKLNNYHGYTEDIQKDLDEVSLGTASEQLKTLLERMVARGDCKYEFANNRAKEIAADLGKPESKASMEVRYLKPLRFT